jgi:hypothetical protein
MSLTIIIFAALVFATTVTAEEPKALRDARQAYQSLQHPSETQRIQYITRLVRLRESFTHAAGETLDAIDAEVIRHPMPAASDAQKLLKRLVGRWQSPRHPYFYHVDGTWASDNDTPQDSRGTWRIEGNQFFQNYRQDTPARGETIILLTGTDFIYGTDAAHPYYLRRGNAFPWR